MPNARLELVKNAAANDADQPPFLPRLAEDYFATLLFERRLSKLTVANYRRDLVDLVRYSNHANSASDGCDLTHLVGNDIRRFLVSIHSKGMTPRAIARMLSGWRGYFNFLIQQRAATSNPCDGVKGPKSARPLPRTLSPDEAVRLVSFEDATPNGLRDRAAFELIYAAGLRIAELTGLNLNSIDTASGEIRVVGKGNKTRIVPVGKPALLAVDKWLAVRSSIPTLDQDALFLGRSGKRITATVLQKSIKQWAIKQGITSDVHPHMLRHSFASHVLQSSQNLRAVQEMMGHESIASTQLYTHLDFQHLAMVYDSAHPRALNKKQKKKDDT